MKKKIERSWKSHVAYGTPQSVPSKKEESLQKVKVEGIWVGVYLKDVYSRTSIYNTLSK